MSLKLLQCKGLELTRFFQDVIGAETNMRLPGENREVGPHTEVTRARAREAIQRLKNGTSTVLLTAASVAQRDGCSVLVPSGHSAQDMFPAVVWLSDEESGEREIEGALGEGSEGQFLGIALGGDTARDDGSGTVTWDLSGAGIARAEDRVFHALDAVLELGCIDPKQVFLAGAGAGGTMALAIAVRHADRFCGVASVDGGLPEGGLRGDLSLLRNLRILLLHSRDSQMLSIEQACELLTVCHSAGLYVTYRLYSSAQRSRASMVNDLGRWLRELVLAARVHQEV